MRGGRVIEATSWIALIEIIFTMFSNGLKKFSIDIINLLLSSLQYKLLFYVRVVHLPKLAFCYSSSFVTSELLLALVLGS